MNLFQLIILLSLGTTFVVGILVISAQPRRKINQSFLILNTVVSLWLCSLWASTLATSEIGFDFWIRQSSILAALISPGVNLLRLSILDPRANPGILFRRNAPWIAIWLLIAIMCQTPAFLQGVRPPGEGEILAHPDYGWAFLIFGLYFVAAWVILFRKLAEGKRSERGHTRSEIEYVMLSCGAGQMVSLLFYIVPNITALNDLGVGLPLGVILFSGLMGYGIATRGILDVPVMARRVVAYTMLGVYLVFLYALVLHLTRYLLVSMSYPPEPLSSIIAACAIALSVSPMQGAMQQLANKLFVHNPPLDLGETLREASQRLYTVHTADELYLTFEQVLKDTLETRDVRIFLKQDKGFRRVYPPGTSSFLGEDHPLAVLLGGDRTPVVHDLLDRFRKSPASSTLRQDLEARDISAALGLYTRESLEGILILGPRTSGRIYGQLELKALEGLRDQFGVALENAQLQEKVQLTERLASLGTLSAGMAHEIKNPLVTLKTFTQLLPERYEDEEFRESFTKLAGREIERIDTLVNQLLHFARPIKPDFRPLSIQNALRDQLDGFAEQAQQDGIDLQTVFLAEQDYVLGDLRLLQQVFLNLLLNARDAMKEAGGNLTVRCANDRQGIAVEISDTGEGIDSERISHIFDPFYSTKSEGTGLGLAVAHRILEEHHVSVNVRSKPGQGTTFRLVFPLLPEGLPK